MDEQKANTDEVRKVVREELALLEEKKRREQIERVYWHQCARCAVYGFHPPCPPEWLKIPWEPEKKEMSTKDKIVVSAIVAVVVVMVVGTVAIVRIACG